MLQLAEVGKQRRLHVREWHDSLQRLAFCCCCVFPQLLVMTAAQVMRARSSAAFRSPNSSRMKSMAVTMAIALIAVGRSAGDCAAISSKLHIVFAYQKHDQVQCERIQHGWIHCSACIECLQSPAMWQKHIQLCRGCSCRALQVFLAVMYNMHWQYALATSLLSSRPLRAVACYTYDVINKVDIIAAAVVGACVITWREQN